MKQLLTSVLQILETQTTLLLQVCADVKALKAVLRSLDGRASEALRKQVQTELGKLQSIADSHLQEIEMLRQVVSQLPGQGPN